MTKRSERIINAFINCVDNGEYGYAAKILKDNLNTICGFLSESDKDVFYNDFSKIITEGRMESDKK